MSNNSNLILFISLIFIFLSCQSSREAVVRYKANFSFDGERRYIYYLTVPGKYTKLENRSLFTGNSSVECRVTYPDSSIIYINDNIWFGSGLNNSNIFHSIYRDRRPVIEPDTIHYSGKQENGKYWRESLIGEIIVGYVNVSEDNKELYDQALNSLRKSK